MKYFNLFSVIMACALITSCNESTEDEFENANGNVKEKYISKLEVIPHDVEDDPYTININYDSSNRVSSVTDGESSRFLNYDGSGKLDKVTGADKDALSLSELYQAPYDAFDSGLVNEYDEKGNPTEITTSEYDYETDKEIVLTGKIGYDHKPNAFFYTLQAGGILDVLDKVQLNFSPASQSPTLVKARMLLPNNNISSMIFKDSEGITHYDIQIDYVYDEDNYPTSATVTGVDSEGSISYTVNYYYKN